MTSKLVNSRIHEIFDKRQLVGEQRRVFIAQALDCSMATARRRDLTGGWTIDEVSMLAKKLGISSEAILQSGETRETVRAITNICGVRVTTLIEVGEMLRESEQNKLCCWEENGRWTVDFSENAPSKAKIHRLKKLTYLNIVVAVVDDNREALLATTSALNALGFDAIGYESKQALLESIETLSPHAFIIDWKLGEEQADTLLNLLRKNYPTAPIIVLTGEAGAATIDHGLLVETLRNLGLQFHQKPAAPSLIGSQIFHMLDI